jgi:hypothetical protein
MVEEHWALVTDGANGQNRSALAAIRALGMAGYRTAVTVSGPRSVAGASRFCDRLVPVPTVDDAAYAESVAAELARHPYVAVLPASDAAIHALDAPGRDLLDKAELAVRAAAVGLKAPPGRRFASGDELRAAAGELDYPCVVKPLLRTGSRHLPTRRFDSEEELRGRLHPRGPLLVQPALCEEIHAIVGVAWRGRLVAAAHQVHERIWPADCGDACYAVTTAPEPELEAGLEALLADFDGVFQAEFAGPYLLDLNPRVYGSLALAVSAGANLPAVFCDLLRRIDVPPLRARPGVTYHWWEGDVRHLASQWRAGELGAAEAVRALDLPRLLHPSPAQRDPRPAIERCRYVTSVLGARLQRTARRPSGAAGRDAELRIQG